MRPYREYTPDQAFLLPPSLSDLLPEDDPVFLLREILLSKLDLSAFHERYRCERGQPPYHPALMVGLFFYGGMQRVYSSRRLAQACVRDVGFMVLTGGARPDYHTIGEFRQRFTEELADLFVQVLGLCQEAGLVRLGHISLDGTKLRANASRHKAMSYGRMKTETQRLRAAVRKFMDEAEEVDREEDEEYGKGKRGDELPDWVKHKQQRLEKIREARARLEAEAKAQAAEKGAGNKSGGSGRPSKTAPGTPKDTAQTNFTDPESRIMKSHDGFIQAYNVQAAVDADSQVIVAQGVTNNASDSHQLTPMVAQIKQNTGRQARELSADAGYCSEDNLKELKRRHIKGYIATGRQKHGQTTATGERKVRLGTYAYAMWQKLRRGGQRSHYRLRKQTVEPVFGQIKQARGFRQFLFRGVRKVAGQWSLICTVHNLLKLAAARS